MGRSAQLFGRPDLSDFREETASPRRSATQHELARIELLAGLPGETLALLGQRMDREEVAPGTVLVREGEPDDRFYVLLTGVLAVSQRDLGARSVLRPGDYFGEVAPAMDVPRTATVSAMTPAVVASCDRATFDELLRPLFADDD
jgi:CRP-like cAMP-binding protein